MSFLFWKTFSVFLFPKFSVLENPNRLQSYIFLLKRAMFYLSLTYFFSKMFCNNVLSVLFENLKNDTTTI